MFILNNIKVSERDQRTIGDTQYPPDWFLNPLERAKVGMTEVPDPVRPDDNLFTSVENPDGSYTATARTAADLAARFVTNKAAFILQVKAEAGALTQQVLQGLGSEYELAEKEATAYKAAGYPATPIPSSVEDEIASKAAKGVVIAATTACDNILAAATGWRNAQAALRRNRLTVTSAAEVAVDGPALDAIRAQRGGFMHDLYSKLGIPQNSFQRPISSVGFIEVTIV